MSSKQSDSFKQNRFFWTVFGLWPGQIPNKYYKYFSFTYVIVFFVAYNVLLTLNLYYTPRAIELIIHEIVFFFTEIALVSKVATIIFKRNKLVAIFDLLDREEFKGNDETGKEIVRKYNGYYKTYLLIYTILSNFSYFSIVLFPVIGSLIFKTTLDLPICQYYFLSDETRNDYFTLIFLYQAFGMYGHMMYNVNIDTFLAGLMVLAIAQVKVIYHDLENLKVKESDNGSKETLDQMQQQKLRKIVDHYSLLLEYCKEFQNAISATLFVQYSLGACGICVILYGLLLPSTVELFMFMVTYLTVLNLEIFIPAWLGTQLSYESQELMVAAYKSEWLPRSESYKRSLRLFVERAKHPIVITGLKIFPLSLATYISVSIHTLLALSAYKSEWLPRSESYKRSLRLFVERAKHPVVITGLKIFPLSLATYISVSIHTLLALSAYKSEWLPRSESYKRSLRLFVERAKHPIVITGLKIFPLSLATYISVSIHTLLALSAYKSEWLPRSESYKRSLRLFVERAKHPVVITGLKIFPLSLATYISVSIHTLLALSAYKSEWLPRSESYKRSLRLFVERAKHPVVITGLKIFPLSLATYISVSIHTLLALSAYKSEWLPRSESYKRSLRLFVERAKHPVVITGLKIFPLSLATYISVSIHTLLALSAYKSEWLPRSESYKRSLRLFVERAKHPVVITGLKIFPLSLATYISIMKMAYSSFTMLRIIIDRQEQGMH